MQRICMRGSSTTIKSRKQEIVKTRVNDPRVGNTAMFLPKILIKESMVLLLTGLVVRMPSLGRNCFARAYSYYDLYA